MAAETGMPQTPHPKGNLYWGLFSHRTEYGISYIFLLLWDPDMTGVPKMHFQYLCLYTYTYIHKQGQGLCRVTEGTRSQGKGCSTWGGLCHPTLSAEGGRE